MCLLSAVLHLIVALQSAQDSVAPALSSTVAWDPVRTAIVGALAGAAGTGIISYILTKTTTGRQNTALAENLRNLQNDFTEKEADCKALEEKLAKVEPMASRYYEVRAALQRSAVVKNYHQPVLL